MTTRNRKPDHYLKAVLNAGEKWTAEIPCKVFLPKSAAGDPKLVLRPTREQFYALTRYRNCSLLARVGDAVNYTVFKAEEVRVRDAFHTSWGEGLAEFEVEAEPWDLAISRVQSQAATNAVPHYAVAFRITPSRVLKPFSLRTFYRSGGLKIEYPPQHQLTIEVEPGLLISFKHYYSSRVEESGTIVQEPELVGVSDFTGSPLEFDSDRVVVVVDDLLLLTSFAERQRCALRGWILESPGYRMVFYRSDRHVPKHDPTHSRNDYLIQDLDIKEFLQDTYPRLRDHASRSLVRSALEGLTCEGSTIGEDFLRYFSALETVLLIFRREKELEFIFANDEWAQVRRELRRVIRGHELLKGGESGRKKRRALLYENLGSLNRISLGTALACFGDDYSVFGDLWPVTSTDSSWSLTTIRNRIVHGEAFTEREWEDIAIASEHLRWTAERMVLAVLGWPPEKSRVNTFYGQEMARLNDWVAARRRLSREDT